MPAVVDGNKLYISRTEDGLPAWVREDAEGQRHTIVSAAKGAHAAPTAQMCRLRKQQLPGSTHRHPLLRYSASIGAAPLRYCESVPRAQCKRATCRQHSSADAAARALQTTAATCSTASST
jgi:hypothetical protein